ncbi:MAG: hypothetical protein KDA93_10275 [Planctomycetaceae bacterium]|nr:hypothetical protein [Planctomycetaceae bacterium]
MTTGAIFFIGLLVFSMVMFGLSICLDFVGLHGDLVREDFFGMSRPPHQRDDVGLTPLLFRTGVIALTFVSIGFIACAYETFRIRVTDTELLVQTNHTSSRMGPTQVYALTDVTARPGWAVSQWKGVILDVGETFPVCCVVDRDQAVEVINHINQKNAS